LHNCAVLISSAGFALSSKLGSPLFIIAFQVTAFILFIASAPTRFVSSDRISGSHRFFINKVQYTHVGIIADLLRSVDGFAGFVSAIVALSINCAGISPASRAHKFVFLLLQPLLDTYCFYSQQIVDKVHVVFMNMSFVELIEVGAGEIITFVTKLNLFFLKQNATFFNPRAFFILNPAAFAPVFKLLFF
jgi:hypothetical protein